MEKKNSNYKNTSLADVLEKVSAWWSGYYRIIFILTMVASMVLGIYFWYVSLHVSIMTEQEKTEYKVDKDRGIEFREKDFDEVVRRMEKRKDDYLAPQEEVRNVFK